MTRRASGIGSRADRAAPPTAPRATLYAAYTEGLVKVYGEGDVAVRALAGIDVGFEQGRLTAVIGPSGAGKSTLLRCLSALEPATRGKVCVGDVDLTGLDVEARTRLRRDRVGLVLPRHNLVPTLTVAENITLPLFLSRRPIDPELMTVLVAALGLRERVDQFPQALSAAQQLQVAVARALVTRPELVCADEPTAALGQEAGQDLLGLFRKTVDTFGQTVVLATHDPFAAAVADRVVFLRDGRIVADAETPTADVIMRRMRDLHDAR
jgi:putative ABC transport system ATP-binding protein